MSCSSSCVCLADRTGTAASFTATFSRSLVELGHRHPELVAITAAMPDSTGTLAFAEQFPDRFLDYSYGRFLLKERRLDESRIHLDRAVALSNGRRAAPSAKT